MHKKSKKRALKRMCFVCMFFGGCVDGRGETKGFSRVKDEQ